MSMNQKYTWADFLKEHPEYKEKKIKRTSKEAIKAFDAAYKQHLKDYLKDRIVKIDKEKDRAEKRKKEFSTMEAYLTRLEKMRDRTKMLQKNL